MVREIVRDVMFLSLPSAPATREDTAVADDLTDTLKAHEEECVGMGANMIGQRKRIIVFRDGDAFLEMFNPEILWKKDPYETEEGCLSLEGKRRCRRYRTVKVRWQDRLFRTRIRTFSGWTAQIIQHEIDHCDGIVI